ncbi:MAG: alpha-L-rhamnosidase, partial [Bryobacteraceae bacterium]
KIDDSGMRGAGGMLKTPLGVPFRTPAGAAPNCLFLSQWQQDQAEAEIPLAGRAEGVYLLMTGVTFPQASRMEHGRITVAYAEGGQAQLSLRSPETWWPIEQDFLLDDYLFIDEGPLPPRVDLRTGETRLLDPASFKGNGRAVAGGAATILFLPLDPGKNLAFLKAEAKLYGIVVALLAVTLARPSR